MNERNNYPSEGSPGNPAPRCDDFWACRRSAGKGGREGKRNEFFHQGSRRLSIRSPGSFFPSRFAGSLGPTFCPFPLSRPASRDLLLFDRKFKEILDCGEAMHTDTRKDLCGEGKLGGAT